MIRNFTENPKLTLRIVRRLATNNLYKNMWIHNDPDNDNKLDMFLYKMGHLSSTSENTYLTVKNIIN